MQLIIPQAVLLQTLLSGPGYGLELIDRVKTQTKGHIQLNQGTVYPLLREMEAEGLLDSYEGDPLPERGGRRRRYYKVTPEGMQVAVEHCEVILDMFCALRR